jgi:hypothetical protein
MADIGEMGESKFSYWCAEAEIVCNYSKIDKTGWDFFIEFNDAFDKNLPLDMQPPRIEAKVQVKSTKSTKRLVQVSLSNLQRLATSIQPAFFVFIEFDQNNQFSNAYLKHVDEDLIKEILHRLRKESSNGKNISPNKRKMVVKYDPTKDYLIKNGSDLKSSILNCIPHGLSAYQKNKNSILSKVGFEDGYGYVRFILNADDIKSMVDMSLGLDTSVSLKEAKFFNSRFGIDIEDSEFSDWSFYSLTLDNPKPHTKGVLRFIVKNSQSAWLDFHCDCYISIITHPEYRKIRLKTNTYSMYLSSNRLNFEFNPKSEKVGFIDLYKTIKLLHWITKNKNNIKAEVYLEERLAITVNDLGALDSTGSYEHLWRKAEAAKYFFDMFDLFDEKMSINDLQLYGDSLVGLQSVIKLSPDKFKINFNLDGENKQEIDNFVSICTFCAIFSNKALYIVLAWEGKAILGMNNVYTLQTHEVKQCEKFIFSVDKVLDSKNSEEIMSDCANSYIDEGWEVAINPDIQYISTSDE